MKNILAIAMVAMLGLSVVKTADAADYNYVGASYVSTDFRDRSADAYELDASMDITKHFYMTAGYSNGFDNDLDVGTAKLGVGYHMPLSKSTDVYGKFTVSALVSDRTDQEKYGYTAEAGVRSQISENLELRGGVVAANLREASLDSVKYYGTVGAEYSLTKNFKVSADVLAKDGVTESQLGFRMYF